MSWLYVFLKLLLQYKMWGSSEMAYFIRRTLTWFTHWFLIPRNINLFACSTSAPLVQTEVCVFASFVLQSKIEQQVCLHAPFCKNVDFLPIWTFIVCNPADDGGVLYFFFFVKGIWWIWRTYKGFSFPVSRTVHAQPVLVPRCLWVAGT